jgi:hypothetical protein
MYLSEEPDRMNHIRTFLLREGPADLQWDILLEAHEGSKGSDDEAGADAEPLLLDGDNEKSRETKQ